MDTHPEHNRHSAPTTASSDVVAQTWVQLRYELGTVNTPQHGRLHRADLLNSMLDDETWRLVVMWLSSAERRSVDTKRGYADDLIRWCRWVQDVLGQHPVPLMSLTSNHITLWVTHARSEGLATRTQRRRLSVLRSLFIYAIEDGWDISSNPVIMKRHADKPGTEDHRPAGATRALTRRQARQMQDACSSDRDRIVFGMLYTSGLRVSEMCSARVDTITGSVDQPTGVQVRRKGRMWHTAPLSDECAGALARYLSGHADGPLLTDEAGKAVDRFDIGRVTRRLGRQAGVTEPRNVTPHVLRATAITAALDAGIPLGEVQRWAGHAYPQTTQGYWERANALQRDAAITSSLQAGLDEERSGLR